MLGCLVFSEEATPSLRRDELLEAAYRYVLRHGLSELSLRPLAGAVGSSPRVLLYLFGSKAGLVRALLARARADELAVLSQVDRTARSDGNALVAVTEQLWSWLSAPEHRALLTLWVEAYARSLTEPAGPWHEFGAGTVRDWLELLAAADDAPDSPASATPTAVLAVLRGALLDLLATGDRDRTTAAVHQQLRLLAAR
jgi:AcrR family transcriptional regulator